MTSNTHTPRYLSIQSLSKYLDVPYETLRGWIRNNTIPSIKIGGRRLVDRIAIDSMLSKQSTDAAKY